MAKKLLCLLTAFLLAGIAMGQTGTDPNADDIDTAAFTARWNLTSDQVAERVQSVDNINATGGIATISGGGTIGAAVRPARCSQITVIVGSADTYYSPPVLRKKCSGPCPPGHTCTPFKTVTRKVWAICFRRFNCFGVIIWIPIGVRRLCVTDEFNCECKPRCKPIRCFPPRRFNPKTCDCECPRITCKKPFEQDPASCKCRCPKNIVCPRPKILDFDTCKCVCPNKCPPNFFQDPNTCRCICRKTCPRYAYVDRKRCVCVGDCPRFPKAADCNRIESCQDNRDRRCKYFPSFPTHPCQCDCCIPKNPGSGVNCSFYTPFGRFACQYYIDPKTNTTPCKWACT